MRDGESFGRGRHSFGARPETRTGSRNWGPTTLAIPLFSLHNNRWNNLSTRRLFAFSQPALLLLRAWRNLRRAGLELSRWSAVSYELRLVHVSWVDRHSLTLAVRSPACKRSR